QAVRTHPSASIHQIEKRSKRRQRGGQAVEADTELTAYEVEEREAPRRPDHAGRNGQARELGGLVHRVLEAPQRVDHLEVFRLRSGEDTTVGEPGDLGPVELAARGHRIDELRVDVVE